jgi:hypothetical protein
MWPSLTSQQFGPTNLFSAPPAYGLAARVSSHFFLWPHDLGAPRCGTRPAALEVEAQLVGACMCRVTWWEAKLRTWVPHARDVRAAERRLAIIKSGRFLSFFRNQPPCACVFCSESTQFNSPRSINCTSTTAQFNDRIRFFLELLISSVSSVSCIAFSLPSQIMHPSIYSHNLTLTSPHAN